MGTVQSHGMLACSELRGGRGSMGMDQGQRIWWQLGSDESDLSLATSGTTSSRLWRLRCFDVTYGVVIFICYMCASFLLCKYELIAAIIFVRMVQSDCSNVPYMLFYCCMCLLHIRIFFAICAYSTWGLHYYHNVASSLHTILCSHAHLMFIRDEKLSLGKQETLLYTVQKDPQISSQSSY
jgi:hypothetical protein